VKQSSFDYRLSAASVSPYLRGSGALVLLDSSFRDAERGRYSYLCANPTLRISQAVGGPTVVELRGEKHEFRCDSLDLCALLLALPDDAVAELPPFTGGLAGYVGYDIGASWHGVSSGAPADVSPALQLAWYDVVLAWDHVDGVARIICRPSRPRAASVLAAARLLEQGQPARVEHETYDPSHLIWKMRLALARCARGEDTRPGMRREAPRRMPAPRSDFGREEYEGAVQRVRDYILAGDVFQVNIAQQFSVACGEDPWDVYTRIRDSSPAHFAAYIEFDDVAVLSSSPELFLDVRDGRVETRPIKGTRRRGGTPAEDMLLAEELLRSEKDRAENLMIVDLLRNDLSRACRPGSVYTAALCELERWANVQHLVSSVRGTLRARTNAVDVLRATFPGGSITGAPKRRAMQIIAELERVNRGVYCGALGYLSANGNALLNVAIRTITVSGGVARLGAGGGVVLDSNPAAEYDESCLKAAALLEALAQPSTPRTARA
jgi:para-aminobenzoate synthetase component 1